MDSASTPWSRQKIVQLLSECMRPEFMLRFEAWSGRVIQLRYHTAVNFLRDWICLMWILMRRCISPFNVRHQNMIFVSLELEQRKLLTKFVKYSNCKSMKPRVHKAHKRREPKGCPSKTAWVRIYTGSLYLEQKRKSTIRTWASNFQIKQRFFFRIHGGCFTCSSSNHFKKNE